MLLRGAQQTAVASDQFPDLLGEEIVGALRRTMQEVHDNPIQGVLLSQLFSHYYLQTYHGYPLFR